MHVLMIQTLIPFILTCHVGVVVACWPHIFIAFCLQKGLPKFLTLKFFFLSTASWHTISIRNKTVLKVYRNYRHINSIIVVRIADDMITLEHVISLSKQTDKIRWTKTVIGHGLA